MDPDKKGPSFVRKERPKKGSSSETPRDAPERPGPDQPDEAPRPRQSEGDRIVIPREDRGTRRSPLDVELREVRRGTASRGVYLRVVPAKRRFRRVGEGHIEVTRAGSKPAGTVEAILQSIKGTILGSPLAIRQAAHERLTKIKALAIMGSDLLSSSAYATEEALIILAVAGSQGLDYLLPIGIVVAALLALVTISYRQTIAEYPGGGGAYAVAHDNLGRSAGLIAAGALLVDYTLVVSVSVSAGVAAITSAVPDLYGYRVPLAVGTIALFTLGNLRGARESGTIFAVPTYFFILMMGGTVIYGVIRVLVGDAPGSLTEEAPPDHPERLAELTTGTLTLWLVLRAFSSGASALTGVEAMANGVPFFQKPESDNARKTMIAMAGFGVFLFLGITFLSSRFGLVPSEEETLVSDMGRTILGENVIYYVFQAATAMILFLASNTSFSAFPLLAAILAKDRYVPRQFSYRGDRLAFSNGIILLALIATLLLVVFDADVSRLIPLYAVGVFVAFTLSQAGMVRRWWRKRSPGWRARLFMNGLGAIATGIVAVVIGVTKFLPGAWISVTMVVILVIIFSLIKRHYNWYERMVDVDRETLRRPVPPAQPLEERGRKQHVIVPVDALTKVTVGAIDLAREISSNITAVHLTDDPEDAEEFREEWDRLLPEAPLLIIESPYRAFAGPMVAYVESLERSGDEALTVVLPGFKAHHWWERILHNQAIRRLRPFLEENEAIRVVDFDYDVREQATA